MKRNLLVSLIAIIVASLLFSTFVAVAKEVVVISNQDELIAFSERVNQGEKSLCGELSSDIEITKNFVPIGFNSTYKYLGEFNGNGHTITLNLDLSQNYVGLFGYIGSTGSVLNIKTAGTLNGNTIVGGIAGRNDGKIYNSSSSVSVTGTQYAGGIVGRNYGIINKSFSTGKVKANSYAGGICGINGKIVKYCYSTATISGSSNSGGLVGANSGTDAEISNCFVYSTKQSICGYNNGKYSNCYYLGSSAERNAAKFASGAIAYQLNSKAEDEELWAQGEKYPKFVSDGMLQTRKIVLNLQGTEDVVLYTNSEGKISFPLYDDIGEIEWKNEENIVDENTVFTEDAFLTGFIKGETYTSGTKIVATKAENSIGGDVSAYLKGNDAYLFLPENADLSAVVYSIFDKNGNVVETKTVDFSDGKTVTEKLGYITYTVHALKSTLPALFININEEFGTIDEMNSSKDHSVQCYGDAALTVPEALALANGWENVKSKEDDEDTPGSISIKGRGNSSWSPELGVKKAYQIKFEKKTSLLGMYKAKKWCLLRDNSDIYKNPLAFQMARDLGLEYSCESEFADVYMNGEYLGTYLITDKIEIGENSVNLADIDKAYEKNGNSIEGLDLTGGYLLEIDNTVDTPQFTTNGSRITIKGPEDIDTVASKDSNYSYIVTKISDLFDAIFGDGNLKDGTYFMDNIDVESFAKYFWHQELLGNMDSGSGSTYLYKPQDSVSTKFFAGPVWDNDYTLTQKTGWILPTLRRGNVSSGARTLFCALCEHKEFTKALIYYYENGVSDTLETAPATLSGIVDEITESENMNEIRWNKNNKSAALKDEEAINTRLAWLKNNYKDVATFSTKDKLCKVTYNVNGEVDESLTETLVSGEKADLTKTATKEKAEFIGWNTDKDAKVALDELVVENSVELFAIFEEYPQITIGDAEPIQGESFEVEVNIKNCSKVAAVNGKLIYDGEKLELTDVKIDDECLFSSDSLVGGDINNSGEYGFVAYSLEGVAEEGRLMTLVFNAKEDCALGETVLKFENLTCFNIEENPLQIFSSDKKLNIVERIFGDVNDDSVVDARDLLCLVKFFADWDIEINEKNADVTHDDKVDAGDLLKFAKFLAGWQVVLGK